MSPLALPWSMMFLPIFILSILFLRELLIAIRIPRYHPELKMVIFNSTLLFFFIIGGLVGIAMLRERDRQFTQQFPRYPTSRYAPERELFRKESGHVYVTSDEPKDVVHFYSDGAKIGGYHITLDDDVSQTGRIMIEKASTTLFLTAVKEKNITVLYFSPEGEMKTTVK